MQCNHRFDMDGIAEDLSCELSYGHYGEHRTEEKLNNKSFSVSWETSDLDDYVVEAV